MKGGGRDGDGGSSKRELFAQGPYGGKEEMDAYSLGHEGLVQIAQEWEVAWGFDLSAPFF